MKKSKCRGNDTILKNGEWYYDGTDELVSENYKTKPCGNCGKEYTKDGHDGCLGNLIGIMNACCGHGNIDESYVQFWDGEVISGEDATFILNVLKKYKRKDGEEIKEIYVPNTGWVEVKDKGDK